MLSNAKLKNAGPATVAESSVTNVLFVITRNTNPLRLGGIVTLNGAVCPSSAIDVGVIPDKNVANRPLPLSEEPPLFDAHGSVKLIEMLWPGSAVAGLTESAGNAETGIGGLLEGHETIMDEARVKTWLRSRGVCVRCVQRLAESE